MKILMVNKFLYPNGGSETYIFEIGKQLQRDGHQVQYFGMEHKGRIVGNRVESYTSDMDFHTGKLTKILYPFKIIYSIEARKKIRRVLDDFQPDAVHLNNFNFQLTPSILYEIRKYDRQNQKRTRIIYTAHDSQLVCPNHLMRIPSTGENCDRCLTKGLGQCIRHKCIHDSRVKSILGSMEGWLYRGMKAYRMIDRIICPSEFMKSKLDSDPILREKTVTMHNFIIPPKRIQTDKKEYVLYFGRYSEEKGIRLLLNACKALPEVAFVFAGSGPLEDEVNRVENVENVGFQKGEKLGELISGALFSVCPSVWYENCPFSVIESIMYKTPVIGADIGGIPELIREGKTGALFSAGDVDELTERIWDLWNDRKRVEEYTQNCNEKNFDTIEEYCEKLEQIYKDSEN